MYRVQLVTAQNEAVATVLVPRLGQMPQVLTWEGRYFQLVQGGRFREASAYAARSELQMRNAGHKFAAGEIEDYKP